MLTTEGYALARDFLKTSARPLERAQFEREFENTDVQPVLEALAAYQNADGGFGHALESDSRRPDSGALATSKALRILSEVEVPSTHPLVRGAVSYLLRTLDPQALTWRIIPEAAQDFPHAPWWDQEDGALERTFEHFRLNPRGDLIALLWHYGDLVPEGLPDRLSASFTDAVQAGVAENDANGHLNVLSVAEGEHVPGTYRAAARAYLREVAPNRVQSTPEALRSHGLPPLALAPSPTSFLADVLVDAVTTQLDFLETSQDEDGAWGPPWSWGPFYPDVWPVAEREWRGVLTLQNLRYLRDYGRLPKALPRPSITSSIR